MFRPNSFKKFNGKKFDKMKEGAVQGGFAFAPLAGFSAVFMLLFELPLLLVFVLSGGILLLGIVWGAVSAARIN